MKNSLAQFAMMKNQKKLNYPNEPEEPEVPEGPGEGEEDIEE